MTVLIESLDREGRGIARVEGKAIFIDGGLPGELVSYASYKKKPNYEQASATAIHAPSAARVVPRCPHFGVCGGCSMQHLESHSQVAVKQRVLESGWGHVTAIVLFVAATLMLGFVVFSGPTFIKTYEASPETQNTINSGIVAVVVVAIIALFIWKG